MQSPYTSDGMTPVECLIKIYLRPTFDEGKPLATGGEMFICHMFWGCWMLGNLTEWQSVDFQDGIRIM